MSKDIGNKCVYCFRDTSFGSGLFVNRISALTDDYDGYSCIECQYIPEEHEEDIKDTENLLRNEIEQIKGE